MTEYVQVANPPTVCGMLGCSNIAYIQIKPADAGIVGLCDIHLNQIMVLRFFEVKSDEDGSEGE